MKAHRLLTTIAALSAAPMFKRLHLKLPTYHLFPFTIVQCVGDIWQIFKAIIQRLPHVVHVRTAKPLKLLYTAWSLGNTRNYGWSADKGGAYADAYYICVGCAASLSA